MQSKMTENKQHWEEVFAKRRETEVSWFQPYPTTSMEFIGFFGLPPEAAIIDVGGGDSRLVDALLNNGFGHITVLDISEKAIERAKTRLGAAAGNVNWIVSDVAEFIPAEKYDLWHDRAAFHFLTTEDQVRKYVAAAEMAIKPGGYLVLGTFSEKGPKKCSGLEIKQYNESSMTAHFEPGFEKVRCGAHDHVTPSGASQNFIFCGFRRKAVETDNHKLQRPA